jgi:hypothetical protein
MAKTPSVNLRPRRFSSPAEQLLRAKLEPVHQPLYSTFYLDAASAPREMNFFQYAVGNKVATNSSALASSVASKVETNLDQAGALSTPKMFLVQGYRVILSQSPMLAGEEDGEWTTEDTAGAGAGKGLAGYGLLSDLKNLMYTSYFKFHVGSKDYFEGPTWMVPGNVGIEGQLNPFGIQTIPQSAGTAKFVQAGGAALHGIGRYFGLGQYPILIPPQQSFNASITTPGLVPPTYKGIRAVIVTLDGILGREVQ